MSIFCKHKFTLTKEGNLWLYDEIFGRRGDTYYYDELVYKITIVCNKCGKIKNLYSKKTKINWYSHMSLSLLGDDERKSFEIKKDIFAKKIQKKYGKNNN